MKRFYLVRHGESEANLKRVHGDGTSPLTERGFEQARFVAERCAKLPVQAIVASTMIRTQQTAEIIAQKLNLPVRSTSLLVEARGEGKYNWSSIDDPDVRAAFRKLNTTYAPGYRIDDEENFDDLKARGLAALKFLSEQPEEHLVVVGHGLFSRILMACAIFGEDLSSRELIRFFFGFKTENSGLTIIDWGVRDEVSLSEQPWRVFVWNDHAHLG